MEVFMERESMGSRIGFILLSAGCAIGIGNVWRFPYITGQYGGGAFVLLYLLFLFILGVPVMTMELAVGRASKKSVFQSFSTLEKKGQKWHLHGWVALVGNYILMMFYTTVAGWMFHYFYLMISGQCSGKTPQAIAVMFEGVTSSWMTMVFWIVVVVALGFLICSIGLQRGVERISKWMMSALLVIMLVLAVKSIFTPGGSEGLKFYLIPDFQRMVEKGIGETIIAAMNQAFFTLSLGIGSMAIFGSYIDKKHTLLGEAVRIAGLDTFVAITAGLIIFPACFAYQVEPDSGPNLIFLTLPNIFSEMPGGRIWGSLFFLFMSFAAFSTVIAVFENIVCMTMELTGASRKKVSFTNILIMIVLSVPCALGFNVWKGITPLGAGSNIMDLEDFIVSNLMLPIGCLIYLLFCVTKYGWGYEQYLAETNTGKGPKLSPKFGFYFKYILPALILVILISGFVL